MPPRKAPSTKAPPQIHLSEEKKVQLENELNWCIQQLELGLSRKDADAYQIKETKRVLTTLQSNSVADVQKRQLMKVIFGDYRKLMKDDKKQREEEENKKKAKEEKAQTESTTLEATSETVQLEDSTTN
ncbi:predicted protein [Naegleria gruberi]|uniref:Predicted protein n=1 Tax=Naegleria gruberi TaxID=5762 RepID=D2VRU9_NAEGR|nr:uncharacterized protein NAEGRDRAFT_71711 [Naegleria gruberi]EFC40452.1 predicted protein [Naegleria gruberi]|eukprot:XP_002673196.1 predicted protein [Naegleria gruberi strain NEG-M]